MTFDELRDFLLSEYPHMFPKKVIKNPLDDTPPVKKWLVYDPKTGRSIIIYANDRLEAAALGEKALGLDAFQAEVVETIY